MPLRLGRDHGLDRFEQPAQRVAMAPRSPYIEGSPSLTAASHCCGVISARSPNRPDPALIVRPHPCCMPWDASIKTFFIFEERLADARSGQFPDWPAVPVELASGGLVDDRPDDRVAPSVTGVGPSLRKRRPSPKLLRCCRPKGEANRPRTWQSCFSGGGLRDTLSIASAQSYRRRSSRTPCASRFGIKAGHTADLLTPPRSTCTPAAALPYAHHWRLARSPNDTFLAGNTHREDTSAFDDLQPVYAALYSAPFIPPPKAT